MSLEDIDPVESSTTATLYCEPALPSMDAVEVALSVSELPGVWTPNRLSTWMKGVFSCAVCTTWIALFDPGPAAQGIPTFVTTKLLQDNVTAIVALGNAGLTLAPGQPP